MTAHLLFDKLAYVDRLKASGVDELQARAHADGLEQAFREEVATKSDLAALTAHFDTRIAAVQSDIVELKGEIVSVRTELKGEIVSVRTELKGEIELKIAQAKNETLKWIFTFNLALVGAIFAIVKFVH